MSTIAATYALLGIAIVAEVIATTALYSAYDGRPMAAILAASAEDGPGSAWTRAPASAASSASTRPAAKRRG